MAAPVPALSRVDLLARLAGGGVLPDPLRVELPGGTLPLRIRRGSTPALVVLFHGAVDRAKRKIPYFAPFLAETDCAAHQVSVSDPSMERPGTFAAAWYCGHAGLALQKLLPDLLQAIATALGARRTVYLGASSGGFAALFTAGNHPGSVAVAVNPQTVFARYLEGPITRYRTGCWPETARNVDLDQVIASDLGALYARGSENAVVYVQNSSDRFHLQHQFTPFLTDLSAAGFERLVCDVGFWGVHGHSGSIPAPVYTAWTRAALEAEGIGAEAILDRHRALTGTTVTTPVQERPAPATTAPPRDIELSRRIAGYGARPAPS